METETRKPVNKILVVTLDNLGDAVMATSLFRPLRQVFPAAKIGFWVKKYAEGLFLNQSSLDTLHASDPFWDKSPGQPKGKLGDFLNVAKAIRKEKYDAALVLNAEWRRSFFLWKAGIPVRVGYNRRKSGFFLTETFPVIEEPLPHVVDEHRRLLESWIGRTFPDGLATPRVEVGDEEKKWVEAWLRKIKWEKNLVIVIHPFAGNPNRWWPLEKWVQLMYALVKWNDRIRFVISCGAVEKEELNSGLAALPRHYYQLMAGVSLQHVKATLQAARLFVGADSGPGHLAAAVGTPVVSLFGESTDPARYAPRSHSFVRVLRRVPIRDLAVEEVKKEIFLLLEQNDPMLIHQEPKL